MNFYKKIEILLNEKQWAYYSDMDKYKSLETIIKNPRDFIKKYLERGDKLPPKLNNALNNLSIGRCYHTISIFSSG